MYVKDYSSRKIVIIGIFVLVALVFVIRLYYLQLIDNSYKLSAENIVLRYVTQYPARGRVVDRNGELLVYNDAAYDLLVIPRQVREPDTALLCKILGIDRAEYENQMNKARHFSYYKPSVFAKQISKVDAGLIGEKLYLFHGFYLQTRTLRKYPFPVAAHLLGSIGEVSQKEIEKDAFYHAGDYIGKSGIEKYYEKELRGRKGMKVLAVDVHNREKGSYRDGKYDTLSVAGKDIVIGLDAGLQYYGEQLMQNKKGSIVAIDPATGEILAMVSSPCFDPNMLVGRKRSENYKALRNDSLKPLLNRAISGTYPPGSTFKMINALIALQEKAIRAETEFSCKGPLSTPIRCTHNHKSPLDLEEAITQSCNPYFWNTFKSTLNKTGNTKQGYEDWYNDVVSLGFGHKFNTDIPYEVSGNIPTKAYFDKLYRGSWNALTVRSLSIGQGEILVTPIQLANLVAIIANKGYYYPPHLLRRMEGSDSISPKFTTKKNTAISPGYFDIVRKSMMEVFEGEHGTARWYKMDSIQQCGKTGTVQNPHGDDHSLFIAFAPMDNPRIAITVIVENAGFGSSWAAPIASLMMEKYLTGKTKRKSIEQRMFEKDLIHDK
ncbi:MAG: penicillin-binding protein 2 [Bacteroidales bacterium]|nr:penicillin-binding protein 2 [Bacteroidales bacterium]